MSAFSEAELAYLLGGRQLGRLATVGADGMPHVIPVGWSYNPELDSIDVGGRDPARTKKFRDVARTGRAAIVVDDDAVAPAQVRGNGRRRPHGDERPHAEANEVLEQRDHGRCTDAEAGDGDRRAGHGQEDLAVRRGQRGRWAVADVIIGQLRRDEGLRREHGADGY